MSRGGGRKTALQDGDSSRRTRPGGLSVRLILATVLILLSIAVLETARFGVTISRFEVGRTPAVAYAKPDADGPLVVVAHGFAGSQQMMQGYALPLARAGYRIFAFDFEGHGRHPVPMSGDVSAIEGTTRLLVQQTGQVVDDVSTGAGPVALVGHSMATDILVRVATDRDDIGPLVLISAFSNAVGPAAPDDLLLVTGSWEPRLLDFALEAVRMVDPDAGHGDTVESGGVSRRSVVAPFAEHVSVLHSRAGRGEAVAWLDRAYGRDSNVTILPTGWAILGLMAGIVLIFRPVSRLLPQRAGLAQSLTLGRTALILALPLLLAPLVAVSIDIKTLPVLVADYLALHMLIYGALQLALLRYWQVPAGPLNWPAFALLLAACAIFGMALDRYAANFWPTSERAWIIAAMMIGALPYMIADATLTYGQTILGRAMTRAAFLLSLGIAVALDFEGLFFLILIAPVMVLFYLVFGTMGRDAARRAGPLASGLATGLVLAWALGVSFPLFQG